MGLYNLHNITVLLDPQTVYGKTTSKTILSEKNGGNLGKSNKGGTPLPERTDMQQMSHVHVQNRETQWICIMENQNNNIIDYKHMNSHCFT